MKATTKPAAYVLLHSQHQAIYLDSKTPARMFASSLVLTAVAIIGIANAQGPGPSAAWNVINPGDAEAIRSIITLDAVATDTQQWDLLRDVFTTDVQFNYSASATGTGIDAIIQRHQDGSIGFTSQHLYSNILISGKPGGRCANASYYAIATLFTDPQQSPGQYINIYGYFNDRLVKTRNGWRISYLEYNLFGPGFTGNMTIIEKPNI